MPYVDLLRGLKALFLERPEATSKEALLDARAPGLSGDERRVLASLEDDRVDIYVGMLRSNQATMLDFVAPLTVEVTERYGGVPRTEFARATLVETPRRSSRLRELSQRVVDHLEGFGRKSVERCASILDLARLERAQTEAFYAPDVDDALAPREFARRVVEATVDEVLAFQYVVAPAVQIVELQHDVLAWRDQRHQSGSWGPPPPRLDSSIRVLVTRDPESLQPVSHRMAAPLLELALPSGEPPHSLESLAERWIDASGVSPDDADAPARFFEQAAEWVRLGILCVLIPVGGTDGNEICDPSDVAPPDVAPPDVAPPDVAPQEMGETEL